MARLNMRKFAKVNGISYYNAKKYLEDGIIHQDENNMIDSGECIRILRKELQDSLKHYAVFLTLDNQNIIDDIRKMMNKEEAVEVHNFDEICIKYNKSLQEYAVNMSEDISKKYKKKVLSEFVTKYVSYIHRQVNFLCENEGLAYTDAYRLVAFGNFPEGYEQLKDADLNALVNQNKDRVLLKCNKDMEDKFDKICRSLLIYWDGEDEKPVFTRSEITEDFLKNTKGSQLYKDIINNPKSFAIGNGTALFEELSSNYKTIFKPKVLAEFASKRFYHIVVIHDDMNYEENMKLIYELKVSNCSECFVCGTKDLISKHISEGVMLYLDAMQHDWKDNVVYAGDPVSKTNSGVALSEEEAVEPVSEPPETEIIRQSDIEIVSTNEINAGEAIEKLLNSVG